MEDEINLKDYLEVISRQWRVIFAVIVVAVLAAVVYMVVTKPVYEAKANILVRTTSSPSMGSMSGLAQLAGINMNSGGSSLDDLSQLLKSRAIETDVESLMGSDVLSDSVYRDLDTASPEAAASGKYDMKKEGPWKMKTKMDGNFLLISVEHTNPALAADAANAYVDSLSKYWNKLNYSEARNKREYIEKQLPVSEAALKVAEEKLKDMTFLMNSSPAAGLLPMVNPKTVDMNRLQRELEIQESIYKMLRAEYENAKLDEAKEASPFSDVERALVPKKPVRPRLVFDIAVGAIAGLFLGAFIAFAADGANRQNK